MDPQVERSTKFRRGFEALLTPYREEKRHLEVTARQPLITSFFQPTPSREPIGSSPSPSTCGLTVCPTQSLVIVHKESSEDEEEVDDPLPC